MSQLHIFNPSHDEALAANSPYYYPAKAARILGADLALLPAWWAQPGDWILVPREVTLPTADFTGRGIKAIHLDEFKKLKGVPFERIQPWGWDPLLVHQLQKAGVDASLLPDADQLQVIRQLSSRETAVQVLKEVRQDLPGTIGTSFWCTEEQDLWNLLNEQGDMMFKAPWSSSGRGVFAVSPNPPENLRQRILRILKEQGAIEAEPLYQRLADFALEFSVSEGKVRYEGLSVFATTETGAYTGNLVGEETVLLHQLPVEIRRVLPQIIDSLCLHLQPQLSGKYEGPLGVDLMSVTQANGTIGIHPCVEINLRRTMGHVALALRNEIGKGHSGIYNIRPVGQPLEENTRQLTPNAQKMEAVLLEEAHTRL